ncbi:hypothetical protein C5167_037453 [Papaver somniferum]|uniref:Uncharacterized protein n=1 Tax=Papaver somniferum TaxID=3469 RepID=A0A4Y7I9K2_PAPSO|nr:hypothetical protein C5167_037453 [Papaver somniferum]
MMLKVTWQCRMMEDQENWECGQHSNSSASVPNAKTFEQSRRLNWTDRWDKLSQDDKGRQWAIKDHGLSGRSGVTV